MESEQLEQTQEAVLTKVIVFQLNEEEFAIDVRRIQSIEKVKDITRIPGASPAIIGVMNLRGIITPVIEVRTLFQLDAKEMNERTRILVLVREEYEAGLIVDGANNVMDIDLSSMEASPESAGHRKNEYVDGVIMIEGRLITMLDLDKLIAPLIK